MKDLLLFDVDGTLAESTLTVKNEMIFLLKQLSKKFSLAIVGGSNYSTIIKQVGINNLHLFDFICSENGVVVHKNINNKMELYHSNDLKKVTSEKTLQNIINHCLQFIIKTTLPFKRGRFIVFRNGMMYCTPIGGDCSYQERLEFMKYDKKHQIRLKLIEYLKINLPNINYDFRLGGNIGVGIHPIGWDKTYCLKFIENEYNNIYFFGDRCTPNGNDYPLYSHNRIIGFHVNNPDDTMTKLSSMFIQKPDSFDNLIERVTNTDIQVNWDNVIPIQSNKTIKYNDLKVTSGKNYWNNLVIVKLNGGLGTSMKCNGPKSILTVKDGYSFLEIILLQIKKLNETHKVDIPLVLMNSYNTADNKEMKEILDRYNNIVKVYQFNQSKIPRIDRKTLKPLTTKIDDMNWKYCPPGTGDFIKQFMFSDVYLELLKNNKTHLFLSNIDNLGAVPDEKILNHICKNNVDLLLEVTDKTLRDIKGGTVIMYKNKLKMLEVAMVPDSKKEEFYSIDKFKIFNTNNYWFNLNSIPINYKLGLLLNPKTVNKTDVYQIEIILPDVISHYSNVDILNVPRTRFLPVKKPNDYNDIISEKYYLDDDYILRKK